MELSFYIFSALAALIALTVHEYCHGYAAYRLGDPTAKSLGRLTLNPAKHLDLFGTLCLIFFHFGWAKPVPVSPRYFKKPKRDFAIVALAGPLSNLLLAFLLSLIYVLCYRWFGPLAVGSAFINTVLFNLLHFLSIFHVVNLGLALFNLIPIPPFDGSRLLNVILPTKWYFAIMKYERYIYWSVIAWLFLGDYVYAFLLSFPFIAGNAVLRTVAFAFSLSGMLGSLLSAISDGMLRLWLTLIP